VPWLWTDVLALVDAERVVLSGETGSLCASHGGEPATTLGALLNDVARPRRRRFAVQRRLHVLIGDPWTYAAVLPWQAGIETAGAWNEYARAMFIDQGVQQTPLRIAVEDAPFGCPRLGVAADASLLAALESSSEQAGWTFAHCRDLLSAAVARHVSALPADCAFAFVERDVLTCLFRRNGTWADAAKQELVPGQPLTGALAVAALLCEQPIGLPAYLASVSPCTVPDGAGVVNLGSPDARLPPLDGRVQARAHATGAASRGDRLIAAQEGACSA
jgi:hypothetical protein